LTGMQDEEIRRDHALSISFSRVRDGMSPSFVGDARRLLAGPG
jgi:hypothetical protein